MLLQKFIRTRSNLCFGPFDALTKKMGVPILYAADISPPCRSVLLAAAAAGVKIHVQEIRLQCGDHRTEEFLKMNPQHTIPTLNDNGFFIGDSHAIVTYLIDKYAKDDSLYPKDLEKRTVINQRLHFNNSVLCTNVKEIIVGLFKDRSGRIAQHRLDRITESYGFLEKFLGDNDWLVAGDTYTLADTSIIASVSSMAVFVPLDEHPKLATWAKRCEDKIPGYATANAPGISILRSVVGNLRSINSLHTVPTLDDNGFFIGDSHAIITYLIDKYAKDDSLYPKDLEKRTVINQRLHFNNSVLCPNTKEIILGLHADKSGGIAQHRFDKITEYYEYLEKFLGDNNWLVAGDTYTLADTSIIASVSSMAVFVSLDKHPKLAAWAKRCENQISGYATANLPGISILRSVAGNLLSA